MLISSHVEFQGEICELPDRLSWEIVKSKIWEIEGKEIAVVEVFSQCFQLPNDQYLLERPAPPTTPSRSNLGGCGGIPGNGCMSALGQNIRETCHTSYWCCHFATHYCASCRSICTRTATVWQSARNGRNPISAFTMSDSVLPLEILDYIFDLLRNEPETLKQCCLVSKSWVPRTRQYLFADIGFYSARTLELWNNTFPDPTNSPASHVGTLEIDCYPGDVEGADWIRTFSCVGQLRLHGHPILPFALFHGLSHNLKSLYVRYIEFSCPELFDFICSFPLLENLNLVGEEVLEDNGNDFHGLQSSPPLTGSLKLIVSGGMGSAPRHLLSLPNGLRFRELVFLLVLEKDLQWIKESVLKCSNTLTSSISGLVRFGSVLEVSLITFVCRHPGSHRPLKSDKIERFDISVESSGTRTSHRDARNHHAQTPGSPTGLNLSACQLYPTRQCCSVQVLPRSRYL